MQTETKKSVAQLAIFWAVVALLAIALAKDSRAQTPPVSTITEAAPGDPVIIHFTVAADNPWDTAGGVGIYWTLAGSGTWQTIGGHYQSPVPWSPPGNGEYHLFSTVEDNMGNNEGYSFETEAVVVIGDTIIDPPPSAETWVDRTVTWTAPTTGSEVEYYILTRSIDGVATDFSRIIYGTNAVVSLLAGHANTVKVAGVDAQGHQGPWSLPSDPYIPAIDLGPPGAPGRPVFEGGA